MKTRATPDWVFHTWASGCGDIIVAGDKDLPIHPVSRILMRVRGEVVTFLFGWWWA